MAVVAYMPVSKSLMAMPTFMGSSPGVLRLAGNAHQPAHALEDEVIARQRGVKGPSWPKPVIEQYTSRG